MDKFLLSEKYRLELHWDKVVYEKKGVCKLMNAHFSGPALQIAEKIVSNDNIQLDFYNQYIVFVKNIYIARLLWGNVVYNKDGTVTLKNAKIIHDTELNRVPKFKSTDYIVIDTKNHEMETHSFHIIYISYVIDENGVLYKF